MICVSTHNSPSACTGTRYTSDMTEKELKVLRAEIAFAIKTNVNGKIDALRLENEQWHMERKEDLERIMPVVLAYEASEQFAQNAKQSGKVVLWIAGFITAVGGAWLILKSIFPWL